MEDNKNLVTDVTENVEQTTEQTPVAKTYTQEEVDAIVGKKKARTEAKLRKEYDRKYGDLIETLKAGTGKESVEELSDTFGKFYESKGIKINKTKEYSAEDVEILAKADANDIINMGYDEVVDEVYRLTELGAENMTAREQAVFKALVEHKQATERSKKFAEMGVAEDVYNSQEFKDFSKKFSSNTSVEEIYDIFSKTQPKKEYKTMGSMKNTNSADTGIKDFYTKEEARLFTTKDFEKNPKLFERVVESSHKWK